MPAADKRKAVQAALTFTQQRRFDKAIAEYQNALRADPQDLTIYKKLGDLYAQTGAVHEAIATYMKLGDLYRADGLAVKAIAIYKMVLNLDPRNMQIYLACADLYAEQGLIGEAKIQYMTVAEHYTKAGEIRKCLEVYQKIAQLDPTNFAVAGKVAEMCEREKLGQEAVGQYVSAARAAARAGQGKEARDFYGRAVRLQPDAFEPLFGLGQLHFEAGAYPEAAAVLEKAAAAAPANPAPLVLLGQCYRMGGFPGQAEGALRRAVEADPRATETRVELARYLLDGGRAVEAYTEFAGAADQFLEESRGEEALALLQDLCVAQPGMGKAFSKLAEVSQRVGREEGAREAQRRLAAIYEGEGDLAAASAIYRKLLEVNPDDAECQARLEALHLAAAPGAAEATQEAETAPAEAEPAEAEAQAPEEIFAPEPEEPPRVLPIAPPAEPLGAEAPVQVEQEPVGGLFGGAGAAEVPGATVEDDAAEVIEQLAEADVYLKYGLVEKAAERLQETLQEFPQNVAARARLHKLFLEEGRVPEAVAEGLRLAEALAQRGDVSRAAGALGALLRVDPGNAEVRARLQTLGGPAPAETSLSAPEPPEDFEEVLEVEAEPPSAGEAFPPAVAEPAASVETLEGDTEGLAVEFPVLAPAPEEGSQADLDLSRLFEAAAEGPEEQTVVLEEAESERPPLMLLEEAESERPSLVFEEVETASFEAAEPLRLDLDEPVEHGEPSLVLELGGVDQELEAANFYRDQGMLEEARDAYRRVLAQDPGNAAALEGLAALAPSGPEPAGPVVVEAPPETPPEAPAPAAEVTGETWIPGPASIALEAPVDLDLGPALRAEGPELTGPGVDLADVEPPVSGAPEGASDAPPLIEAAERPPAPPAEAPEWAAEPPEGAARGGADSRWIGPAEDVPVFRVAEPGDEAVPGGFVDLGAEIKSEIEPPAPPPSEGTALLGALLQEFQRGVRENLDARDYETHYNLGIAYKEMDLFDEAIEEFRLAGQDSPRRLTCIHLAALCLLGKGRPTQAVEELLGALTLPGYPAEEYQGLRFDLATAYEAAGQDVLALEALEALVAEAPDFRDAVARATVLRERLGRPTEPPGRATPAPGPPRPPQDADPQRRDRAGAPGAREEAPQGAPAPPAEDEGPRTEGPDTKTGRRRRDKISFV